MIAPDLTIGIVSCNRLHYLRALLESMRECLPLDRLECIVVDNASVGAGPAGVFAQRRFRARRGPADTRRLPPKRRKP